MRGIAFATALFLLLAMPLAQYDQFADSSETCPVPKSPTMISLTMRSNTVDGTLEARAGLSFLDKIRRTMGPLPGRTVSFQMCPTSCGDPRYFQVCGNGSSCCYLGIPSGACTTKGGHSCGMPSGCCFDAEIPDLRVRIPNQPGYHTCPEGLDGGTVCCNATTQAFILGKYSDCERQGFATCPAYCRTEEREMFLSVDNCGVVGMRQCATQGSSPELQCRLGCCLSAPYSSTTDDNGVAFYAWPVDPDVAPQFEVVAFFAGDNLFQPSNSTGRLDSGSAGLFSFTACFPIALLLGLLMAAMHAMGRSPLQSFDFTSVGAPRAKTKPPATLVISAGALAGAAALASKSKEMTAAKAKVKGLTTDNNNRRKEARSALKERNQARKDAKDPSKAKDRTENLKKAAAADDTYKRANAAIARNNGEINRTLQTATQKVLGSNVLLSAVTGAWAGKLAERMTFKKAGPKKEGKKGKGKDEAQSSPLTIDEYNQIRADLKAKKITVEEAVKRTSGRMTEDVYNQIWSDVGNNQLTLSEARSMIGGYQPKAHEMTWLGKLADRAEGLGKIAGAPAYVSKALGAGLVRTTQLMVGGTQPTKVKRELIQNEKAKKLLEKLGIERDQLKKLAIPTRQIQPLPYTPEEIAKKQVKLREGNSLFDRAVNWGVLRVAEASYAPTGVQKITGNLAIDSLLRKAAVAMSTPVVSPIISSRGAMASFVSSQLGQTVMILKYGKTQAQMAGTLGESTQFPIFGDFLAAINEDIQGTTKNIQGILVMLKNNLLDLESNLRSNQTSQEILLKRIGGFTEKEAKVLLKLANGEALNASDIKTLEGLANRNVLSKVDQDFVLRMAAKAEHGEALSSEEKSRLSRLSGPGIFTAEDVTKYNELTKQVKAGGQLSAEDEKWLKEFNARVKDAPKLAEQLVQLTSERIDLVKEHGRLQNEIKAVSMEIDSMSTGRAIQDSGATRRRVFLDAEINRKEANIIEEERALKSKKGDERVKAEDELNQHKQELAQLKTRQFVLNFTYGGRMSVKEAEAFANENPDLLKSLGFESLFVKDSTTGRLVLREEFHDETGRVRSLESLYDQQGAQLKIFNKYAKANEIDPSKIVTSGGAIDPWATLESLGFKVFRNDDGSVNIEKTRANVAGTGLEILVSLGETNQHISEYGIFAASADHARDNYAMQMSARQTVREQEANDNAALYNGRRAAEIAPLEAQAATSNIELARTSSGEVDLPGSIVQLAGDLKIPLVYNEDGTVNQEETAAAIAKKEGVAVVKVDGKIDAERTMLNVIANHEKVEESVYANLDNKSLALLIFTKQAGAEPVIVAGTLDYNATVQNIATSWNVPPVMAADGQTIDADRTLEAIFTQSGLPAVTPNGVFDPSKSILCLYGLVDPATGEANTSGSASWWANHYAGAITEDANASEQQKNAARLFQTALPLCKPPDELVQAQRRLDEANAHLSSPTGMAESFILDYLADSHGHRAARVHSAASTAKKEEAKAAESIARDYYEAADHYEELARQARSDAKADPSKKEELEAEAKKLDEQAQALKARASEIERGQVVPENEDWKKLIPSPDATTTSIFSSYNDKCTAYAEAHKKAGLLEEQYHALENDPFTSPALFVIDLNAHASAYAENVRLRQQCLTHLYMKMGMARRQASELADENQYSTFGEAIKAANARGYVTSFITEKEYAELAAYYEPLVIAQASMEAGDQALEAAGGWCAEFGRQRAHAANVAAYTDASSLQDPSFSSFQEQLTTATHKHIMEHPNAYAQNELSILERPNEFLAAKTVGGFLRMGLPEEQILQIVPSGIDSWKKYGAEIEEVDAYTANVEQAYANAKDFYASLAHSGLYSGAVDPETGEPAVAFYDPNRNPVQTIDTEAPTAIDKLFKYLKHYGQRQEDPQNAAEGIHHENQENYKKYDEAWNTASKELERIELAGFKEGTPEWNAQNEDVKDLWTLREKFRTQDESLDAILKQLRASPDSPDAQEQARTAAASATSVQADLTGSTLPSVVEAVKTLPKSYGTLLAPPPETPPGGPPKTPPQEPPPHTDVPPAYPYPVA